MYFTIARERNDLGHGLFMRNDVHFEHKYHESNMTLRRHEALDLNVHDHEDHKNEIRGILHPLLDDTHN